MTYLFNKQHDNFLLGLQQMITEGIKPFPSRNITCLMVDIVKTVVPQEQAAILTTICDFLIAVHPPAGNCIAFI